MTDGRRIVPPHTPTDKLTDRDILCHPGFRAIFLANRPGFPFLGNDFYSVMGDLLSCHAIDNPDPDSELVSHVQNYRNEIVRTLFLYCAEFQVNVGVITRKITNLKVHNKIRL